jgi:steroid delta-isomerase-like uncharacterized protein
MSEQSKALVRDQFYGSAVDRGDFSLINELFASHCAFYAAGSSEPVDRETFKQYLAMFRAALGFHHVIDDQIAEGNKVVTRWTVHGTHEGEFQGRAPTGNPVLYSGVSIFRFTDGKIDEVWSSFDELGLLRQVGVLQPSPAQV